ncbi:MAG: winged helix-turn-helix transcriptional regulator [Pseudonocardiaceae bacterium]
MLPRRYQDQVCSIARALEVIGDRWTMLVIRDAFLGVRRFDDFQRSLGVARNVLTDRLNRLCDDGVLQRRRYQQRPARYEYELTQRGLDLWPVLVSLLTWGDRYLAEAGPPRLILHRDCGGPITERAACSTCGTLLDPGDVTTSPGPGMPPGAAGTLVD